MTSRSFCLTTQQLGVSSTWQGKRDSCRWGCCFPPTWRGVPCLRKTASVVWRMTQNRMLAADPSAFSPELPAPDSPHVALDCSALLCQRSGKWLIRKRNPGLSHSKRPPSILPHNSPMAVTSLFICLYKIPGPSPFFEGSSLINVFLLQLFK